MKHKIIIEIDGVRHKLIKTKIGNHCDKCSLFDVCKGKNRIDFMPCPTYDVRYRKCKKGE